MRNRDFGDNLGSSGDEGVEVFSSSEMTISTNQSW